MIETLTEEKTKEDVALEPPWRVIVLNDPVNLMNYVVMVFKKVFGFDETRAIKHMREVHEKGDRLFGQGKPKEQRPLPTNFNTSATNNPRTR